METTRCFLALLLMLCSTSLAVAGRLPVKDPSANLHSRRLSAAASPAPPIEFSPTWALPSLDPMQMARDLGSGLAAATNSLSTRLMAGIAGQASPPAPSNQQTAEPNQSLARHFAPAPAPAHVPKQAAAPQPTASATPEQTTKELYTSQVDQLADMVSAVFMVHSATQLDTFAHLNTSHVITAAELAVEMFWHQVEAYVNGTFNLAKNLPEELAGLPKNVSDAAASQQQSIAQAGNSTYLMESFTKLVHDLEEPLGISGGGSVFSYSPCFVNMAPAGISLSATGVNIGAPLVGISPAGISINPQGLIIQPTLISVSPVGVNVSPQGLNIAPALIAVSPGRVSINPQGGNIGGSLISVSAAASP